MSLKHTLLGLLMLHPRTGYDLYKRMEQAAYLLESASLRRIYPTLKQMVEGGLAVYEIEPQEGKPDRKVYTVTDQGQAAFLSWLREPPEADTYTLQRFLAKFFFYGMLDHETLQTRLRDALAARREKLEALQAAHIAPPLGPCRDIVDAERVTSVWSLMLDYGRAEIEMQIQWLETTLQKAQDL